LTAHNDASNSFGMGLASVSDQRIVSDQGIVSDPALRGCVRVVTLKASGIAALAGVRKGDVLLGIDGDGKLPLSQEGVFGVLRALPKGEDVELVVGRL
jgi:C-terminal processing protease CtpA/Prc